MTRFELTGWRIGLNKVALNHHLRRSCGLGLADAKDVVDRLLAGGKVIVECSEEDVARCFCQQIEAAGVESVAMIPQERGQDWGSPAAQLRRIDIGFPDASVSEAERGVGSDEKRIV